MKRKIRYDRVFGIISIFVLLWIFASIVDTNIHNSAFSANYGCYAVWNIFNLF